VNPRRRNFFSDSYANVFPILRKTLTPHILSTIQKPFLAAGENYSKEKKGCSSLSTKFPTSQSQQLAYRSRLAVSITPWHLQNPKQQWKTSHLQKLPTSKPMTVCAQQCNDNALLRTMLEFYCNLFNENLEYRSNKRF
jgi:hypothetical protein